MDDGRQETGDQPEAAVEAVDLALVPGDGGVVWSASPAGVHTNLVVLAPGGAIQPHRNDTLDVLVVVLAGSGTVTVDGRALEVSPTRAVLVPRGAVRDVTAGPEGVRYLTIHAERGPLSIGKHPGHVEERHV